MNHFTHFGTRSDAMCDRARETIILVGRSGHKGSKTEVADTRTAKEWT